MILCWKLAEKVLDQVSNTNRGWHNREVDRGAGTYAIGDSSKQSDLNDTISQKVTQMRIEIGLLTNQFTTMNSKM